MNLWKPPDEWLRIKTIDLHTGGEPLRVVYDGLPEIPGNTILEKRKYFKEHLDHIRKALMWEPRGHADMYGAILTPPVSDESDFGVFFIHNEGYSTMCGHAIIGLTTLINETGIIQSQSETGQIRIDSPSGLIRADFSITPDGKSIASFLNVPSFVLYRDQYLKLNKPGEIQFDIAFGGAFYAFVDAASAGFELIPSELPELIDLGRKIKRSVISGWEIRHPVETDLGFLYGTIFTGPAHHPGHHSRNVCIFADGEVDRSPTGTGVSARAAIHYQRGELRPGEIITIESILDTTMDVRIEKVIHDHGYPAVIPKVSGTAFITGKHEFLINPSDPLQTGFIFR
ncbi:MAG: proline racemase family protein [Bacteroidales bacterium]|nr:proline racemase family protein [Bacteroidales bacterium]